MKNDAPWFRKLRTNLLYWVHHQFQYWSPSINFCRGDVSGDAPVKGTILMWQGSLVGTQELEIM